ncbi:hypothetical protein FRC01_010849 [Tulasnella sp. 417]|nr:hypothetical protein FRC01_010849 [Tulasnella sp. 417]
MRRLAGLSVRLLPQLSEGPTQNVQGAELEAHDNVRHRVQEEREIDSKAASRNPVVRCGLCERTIARREWSQHLSDPGHARKARLATYQQALREGTRDKLGVSIVTGDLDFGVVELDSLEEWPTREDSFYIQVDEDGYRIKNVRMTSSIGGFSEFRDTRQASSYIDEWASCRAEPTGKLQVIIIGNRGRHEDRVEFTFDSPSKGRQFTIVREVKAIVTVTTHHQQLSSLGEYIRPKRRPRESKSSVMDGTKIAKKIAFRVWLPEFKIPPELAKIFAQGSTESQVEATLSMFSEGLDHATYADFWQVLLWLEEHQANKDMENYDQSDAKLSVRLGRNYLLTYESLLSPQVAQLTTVIVDVPGLAERRPSVIIGDSVLVRPTNSPPGRWFRGYVHGIQQTNVSLGFHPAFNYPPGQRVNVEFELNRSLLRRMHWAIAMQSADFPRHILFPLPEDLLVYDLDAPLEEELLDMIITDQRIRENPPQLQAVTAIARLPPGAILFIIFGPKLGLERGRLSHLSNRSFKLYIMSRGAMILVCAPSNNAADIISERLRIFLYPPQLFRLNAPSRAKDLPRGLESYSLRSDDGSFTVPPLATLMQYRIVVSTCASSSLLHGVGIPPGHFTHIFVDEAGQASEPEVMIPIKLNAGPRTSIILAGDPKQLGPVIRSPVARQLGLDRSYLERLMSLPMYEVRGCRGATHVKLIKNWRSHQGIISFPNRMFYDGELEACAPPSSANLCLGWEGLPNRSYPVVFQAIKGRDLRELSSPSWFNIEEASAVWHYVRDLRRNASLGLGDEHIGVIAPYRAQVGTTEEFQGDERHAIILSTVRSSLDFVEFDLRHTLGFVANPRRFNVAMTRAKSILIVIGDPDVLGLDPLWRKFLNHTHAHGGWRGIRIPWHPTKDVFTEGTEGENLPYDAQIRAKSEQHLRDLVARASATGFGVVDEDDELEADADQHWHHDE